MKQKVILAITVLLLSISAISCEKQPEQTQSDEQKSEEAFLQLMKEEREHVFLNPDDHEEICETWNYVEIENQIFLHYYAEPKDLIGHRLSESALYTYDGTRIVEVLSAGECGGSSGGDVIVFFESTQTGEQLMGTAYHAGGFGGNAIGATLYRYESGVNEKVVSYDYIWQSRYNYEEEELLENAELFYDEEGNPFSKENILESEYVEEYRVDDERVTKEVYDEVLNTYRSIY